MGCLADCALTAEQFRTNGLLHEFDNRLAVRVAGYTRIVGDIRRVTAFKHELLAAIVLSLLLAYTLVRQVYTRRPIASHAHSLTSARTN